MIARAVAPTMSIIVCTVSVHNTAVSPPGKQGIIHMNIYSSMFCIYMYIAVCLYIYMCI